MGRGGAAQIEVAVLEARLLTDDLGALEGRGDLERQGRGLVEHDDVAHHDLDLTRGEVLVLVTLGATGDHTGDLEHELGAQRVRDRLVADDDLGDARGVAQVDEGHPTVIAATIDPTGEGDGLTDLLGPQGSRLCGCEARRESFRNMPGRTVASRDGSGECADDALGRV